MPQYMLLMYDDPATAPAEGSPEDQAEFAGWMSYSEQMAQAGIMQAGNALHPVETATTVRVRGGERVSPTGRSPRRRSSSAATTSSTCPTSTRRSRGPAKVPARRARIGRGAPGHGVRPGLSADGGPAARDAVARAFRDESRPRGPGDPRPARSAVTRPGRGRGAGRASPVALARWPRDGVPGQPGGVDHHDRRATRGRSTGCAASAARGRARRRAGRSCTRLERGPPPRPTATTSAIVDDRLRLIFTCCHPALALRGAGGAHAARARRPDHRRDRPRVPRRRADDGQAASCAPSARSRDAGIPYRVPRDDGPARPAARRARASST